MIRTLGKADTGRGGAWGIRLLGGLLALALLPSFVTAQSIEDKYRAQRERISQFNLASAPTMQLNVNQFQCGLTSAGDTCTDVFDSPTGGGGFWPTGSPNQYMFNSGLQVVGIIPKAANCDKATGTSPTCFAWSGDTTGAFFMDASGLRQHGTPITDIYNSLDAGDLANWPTEGSVPDFPSLSAMVEDTTLFNDVLIGRKAASQQDSWVAYWDGDPNKSGGRAHPMGIIVEQRTMAWNYPEGNENVIYFIYRFTNATNNPVFQRVNEARFFGGANALPDAGWTFDSVYVAFDSDPDVGPATNNYATGIMPFQMAISYEGPMYDDAFSYPPDIFRPPFFTRAPGIVAMKYLKSPVNPATGEQVGLTSLSQHTNGAPFNDPRTVEQGWRYISLNVDAGKGDPACSFSLEEVRERRACFLNQSQSDVRVFIGSGPFSLAPGQQATIAVAMFAAATVNTPLITSAPSADNKPGIPSLAPGCFGNPIRPIEVASGWVRTLACPDDNDAPLDQFAVEVVEGSLLGRALVAQAIFDNKFLLGFAPEAPPFYLVPGDNRVTVVWEPSATETAGDPFFAAAGDPENTLYDPNYREFDVEGYRIYRGTSPANMEMIAQFDKEGTTFTDVLCVTPSIDEDTHLEAPPHVTGEPCEEINEYPIHSPFVQFRTVARLESGTPFLISADTALAADVRAGRAQLLEDTGIPYAYVDTDVRNGFQYFYRVTAFDINSVRSGPSSLESAAPAKPTTPNKLSPNVTLASFTSSLMGGTKVLDPNASLPTIDAQTGIFSGPMPPTNGIAAAFSPLVERLLPAFNLKATIDSVLPDALVNGGCPNGYNAVGACWHMFVTFDRDGQKLQRRIDSYTGAWTSLGDPLINEVQLGAYAINPDPTAAAAFGIPAANVAFNATLVGQFYQSIGYSAYEGQANRRSGSGGIPSNVIAGGSRWFSGAANTIPDPAALIRVGHINGVDSIWKPVHHSRITEASSSTYAGSTAMQCFGYAVSSLGRAADVELKWGAGGTATFTDVTHNVPVPFKPTVQASWGFLNTDANGNGVIDYDDFFYIENISAAIEDIGFCGHTYQPNKLVRLENTAKIQPVSMSGSSNSGSGANLTQTGTGFGLYINGEPYIFQMSALPAANATWTLRTYTGFVTASSGSTTWNPSGYAFSGRVRPPMVPGLTMAYVSESATTVAEGAVDLSRIHTVPDPYYAVSQFDLGPSTKELQFVNMPPRATIRIYSLSGVLVDIVNHDAPAGGSVATWNLKNRSGQFVASGVYFYHVTTPDGQEHVGKFTVINAGFSR